MSHSLVRRRCIAIEGCAAWAVGNTAMLETTTKERLTATFNRVASVAVSGARQGTFVRPVTPVTDALIVQRDAPPADHDSFANSLVRPKRTSLHALCFKTSLPRASAAGLEKSFLEQSPKECGLLSCRSRSHVAAAA